MRKTKRVTALAIVFALLAGLLPEFSLDARAAGIALPLSSQTLTPGQTYELAAGNAAGVSFTIPAGDPVTIFVNGVTSIDNTSGGGSPIVVLENGSLHLIINNKLVVYGQDGTTGKSGAQTAPSDTSNNIGGAGGQGGYAGIFVPQKASIDILGTGQLYAYGGDAGDGGAALGAINGRNFDAGNGGGGGAGAGIGGHGGTGGAGAPDARIGNLNGIGENGHTGVSAGAISIFDTQVYAFGGGGGSGGKSSDVVGQNGLPALAPEDATLEGPPGGGYFSAALWGESPQIGGLGGCTKEANHNVASGGGGYSGGTPSLRSSSINSDTGGGGGGYPAAGIGGGGAGGGAGTADTVPLGTRGASGGKAGAGGQVTIYSNANNVHAYNGAYLTEKSGRSYIVANVQTKATPIYAQLGFSLDRIRAANINTVAARTENELKTELSSKVSQAAASKFSGIGSGAGYTEADNGEQKISSKYNISTGSLTITGNNETYYVTGKTDVHTIHVSGNNTHATVYLDGVVIDQRKKGKSAIEVDAGCTLDIITINEPSYLYGSSASDGANGQVAVMESKGGAGAKAAIHVPQGASLNVSGDAALYAYGGDAGNGGSGASADANVGYAFAGGGGGGGYPAAGIGGGGGGAGAGGSGYWCPEIMGGAGGGGAAAAIGGNGGAGGSVSGTSLGNESGGAVGKPGSNGEDAGAVRIDGLVYAYGGAGGAGGNGGEQIPPNFVGGAGGIDGNGGGAPQSAGKNNTAGGGTGGGGYSGGGGGASVVYDSAGGGGYYSNGQRSSTIFSSGVLPGGGVAWEIAGSGNGGAGGSGGQIIIADRTKARAFNGAKTTGASALKGVTDAAQPTTWTGAVAVFYDASQSVMQGVGGGAGYSGTNGNVTVAGAPALAGNATATLVAGDPSANTSATLTFPKGSLPEGVNTPIEQYKIVASNGDTWTVTVDPTSGAVTSTSERITANLTGENYTATVTGLASNADLTFDVFAYNGNYSGALTTGSIHTMGVPLAPENVSASVSETASDALTVSFQEPEYGKQKTNTIPITYYKVVLSGISNAESMGDMEFVKPADVIVYVGAGAQAPADMEAGAVYRQIAPVGGVTTVTIPDVSQEKYTGLRFGTVYAVSVSATNGAVDSYGAAASTTADTPSIPGPVRNLHAEFSDHLNFSVVWDAPANAETVPEITKYLVKETVFAGNSSSPSATETIPYIPNAGDTSYSYTSQTEYAGKPGYRFQYEIVAVNAANETASEHPYKQSYMVVPPITSDAPRNFAVESRGDGQITFRWQAPEIAATDVGNATAAVEYVLCYQLAGNQSKDGVNTRSLGTGTAGSGDTQDWLFSTVDAFALPEADEWQKYDFWLYSCAAGSSTPEPGDYAEPGTNYYDAWTHAIEAAYKGGENGTGDLNLPRISALIAGERALTRPTAPQNVQAETTDASQELRVTWSAPADPGDIVAGDAAVTAYNIYVQPYGTDGDTLGADTPVYATADSGGWAYDDASSRYTYTISGLTDGQKYSVFMTALNANRDAEGTKAYAEGPASAPAATATPRRVPDALQNVKAVSSAGDAATLSWTVPDGDKTGGDPVTGYEFAAFTWDEATNDWKSNADATATYTKGENGVWVKMGYSGTIVIAAPQDAGENTMQAAYSGMTSGVRYRLTVSAKNGAGDSAPTGAEVRTVHSPTALRDVQLTEGDKSLTLTWTAPEDDGTKGANLGESKITGYIVEYKSEGGSPGYQKLPADQTSWTRTTGLSNGAKYTLRIWAFYGEPYNNDKYQEAPPSSYFGPAETRNGIPRTTPHAARISEVATGDQIATIAQILAPVKTGNDPGSGGAPITDYELWAIPVRENALDEATIAAGGYTPVDDQHPDGFKMATIRVENENTAEGAAAAENIVVPDLLNGLESDTTVGNYLIYVRGVNAAGTGEPSNKRFVRVGMPLAPTGLEASLGDSRAVIATYNAAVSNGTPVKYYEIYASDSETGEKKLVNKGVDGVSGSFTGGVNGEELWVFVRAYNGVGFSPYSKGAKVTVGAPTTPQITEISAQTTDVSISWTQCAANGNRFKEFRVYYGDLDDVAEGAEPTYTHEAVASADGAAGSTVLKGLTTGHRYRVYVTAVNQAGESPRSELREFSVGASAKPVIQKIESADGALKVYFTADDASTKYPVYINDGQTAYQTVPAESTGTQDGYKTLTVTGLTNGLTYSVALASVNANGESERSAPVSGTPATAAGQVGGVKAAALSGQSVRVTWDEASDTGGSPVIGYRILIYDNAGNQLSYTADNLGMVNEFTLDTTGGVSNLENNFFFTPDTDYKIGVQAITTVNGFSTFGAVSALVPVRTLSKPGAPQITEVFSDSNGKDYQTVTVRWKAPVDDGGMAIKGYIVYFNGIPLNPDDPERFSTASADGVFEATRPNCQSGMRFKVTVAAVNDVGEGHPSAAASHLVGAPKAPVISKIETTANSFTITWLPVDRDENGTPIPEYSVLSYSLYVKEPSMEQYPAAVTGMVAANAAAESYSRTYEGEPGEYGVRLSANNVYSGDTYTEVTVTIGGLQAPANVAATPGEEILDVSWDAPTDSTGVTGYTVFYGDKSKTFALDALTDGLHCTLTAADGIVPGAVYNVAVAARNEYGVGLKSGAVSARPWGKPVPAKISAVTAQNGRFVFSHTAASCVGFEDAPEYRYFVKKVDGADFTALQSGDFTAADGTVTVSAVGGEPIRNGSTYAFYVEAAFGGKVTVDSDSQKVICGLPDAPQLLSVAPSNKAFTVRLAPSAGSVTAYHIYVTDVEGNYYVATGEMTATEAFETVAASEVTGEYYSLTYSRMSNTALYNVWAVAVNDAGPSGNSNVLTVRPGTAPAPTIQNAFSSDGSITLEWLASSDTTVSKYYVYQDGKQVREVKGTSVTVKGLTNGVQYTFQITAYNTNGESAPSAPRTLAPGGKAGQVQNLTASLADVTSESQSVVLRWEQPGDTGGLPVTYLVTGGSLPPEGVETAQTGYTVTGLTTPGKTLTFAVAAKNDAGVSDEAASVTVTTASRPGAPTITSALGFNGRFSIAWLAAPDGGSEVTGYHIYINGELVGSANPEDTNFYYNGDNEKVPLVASTTTLYEISVKAVNAVGEGEGNLMRAPYLGTLEASVSDPPVIADVVASESGSLKVHWIAPAYNGNSSITGYKVFYAAAADYERDGEAALQQFGGLYGVTDRTAVVTGLTDGTEYVLAVKAVNAKGDSAPSTVARGTPRTYVKPAAPVISAYYNNYEMTETTICFTYEAPQGGEDMPTKFDVYVGLGSKVSMGTAEYVPGTQNYELKLDSALQGGVRYFVRVAATNYIDETTVYETTDSSYIQMCTNLNIVREDTPDRVFAEDSDMDGVEDHPSELTPPKAPGDVKLSRNALSITLEWTAPRNESGEPDANVVGYKVYINTDSITLDEALLEAGGKVTGHTYNGVYAYDATTGVYKYTFGGKQNNSYTCQVSATGVYQDELTGTSTTLESDRSMAMVLYLTPSYERPDNLKAKLIRSEVQTMAADSSTAYSVELSWEAPSQQPTGYMLYVNGKEYIELKPGVPIQKDQLIHGTLSTYQYNNIQVGETYVFRLSAFYGTDELVESPQSIAATVKVVEETGMPEKVVGLTGEYKLSDKSGWDGTFHWDDAANAQKYNVYINGVFREMTDKTYFAEFGRDSNQVCVLEVAGVNAEGVEGPRSDALTCDTFAADAKPTLAAPTELTANADVRSGSISLSWTPVDGATGYEVRLVRDENSVSQTYTLDNSDGAEGSYLGQDDTTGKMTFTIPDYAAIRYLADGGSKTLNASDSSFLLLVYAVDDGSATPVTMEAVQTAEPPVEPEQTPVAPETPEGGAQQKPEDGAQNPEDTTQKPEGGTQNPEDTTQKPEGGAQNPEDTTQTPESGTTETTPPAEENQTPADGQNGTQSGAEQSGQQPGADAQSGGTEQSGNELHVSDAVVPLAASAEANVIYSLPASVGVSTKSTVPDAPTGFTATVPSDLSQYDESSTNIPITLQWTAPSFWGGNGLTGKYRLYVDSTESKIIEIDAAQETYTFDAAANRDYSFRLVAFNSVGESTEAADTANTMLGEKITPPAAPNVTGYLSNGSAVKVLWSAPAENPGEPIDYYLVSIDGVWSDTQISAGDADANGGYSHTFTGIEPKAHAVEVKAVALKAQSESVKITVNPLLNLIDDTASLDTATAPAENAALDANMNGVADSTENQSGEKTIALKGTVTAAGGAGDVVLSLYEDGKEQVEANVIATTKVAWESGAIDFTFEVPAVAEGSTQTYTLVIRKIGCTGFTVTGIDLANYTTSGVSFDSISLYAGDVNGDGIINSKDSNIVKSNLNLSDNPMVSQGDVNGDHIVNSKDSNIIKSNLNKKSGVKKYSELLTK